MFATVLVANRGEIAVRIIRTLHRLGIRSVAIFSEADSRALHVAMADKAVLIGPADARSSYLSLEKVMAAAIDSGAQAIHPGYGFLAENADFAKACESVGIVFIGPSEDSIRLMGDKRAAKDAVAALGIPVVPGFHGQGISDADLALRVAEIGFPVMIKPAAGGGGKGMHVVRDPSDVAPALESARRESLASFGDDALLLERYVPAARHVEVQVVGDGLWATGIAAFSEGTRRSSRRLRHLSCRMSPATACGLMPLPSQ
jgi:acetyl-CoA/propionyl-CoA carboxylase biotin carboxyl carrier protein